MGAVRKELMNRSRDFYVVSTLILPGLWVWVHYVEACLHPNILFERSALYYLHALHILGAHHKPVLCFPSGLSAPVPSGPCAEAFWNPAAHCRPGTEPDPSGGLVPGTRGQRMHLQCSPGGGRLSSQAQDLVTFSSVFVWDRLGWWWPVTSPPLSALLASGHLKIDLSKRRKFLEPVGMCESCFECLQQDIRWYPGEQSLAVAWLLFYNYCLWSLELNCEVSPVKR